MLSAIALLAFSAASPANARNGRIVEPFAFQSGGVKIAGEIHGLNRLRCRAVIAVGGSSARTRSDTALAVPFFLDRETAVVLMDRRGNGQSTGRFEIPNTRNTAWQIPLFGSDVAAVARQMKRKGFRRVVIVGTSMGGWVNDAAAAAAPQAIDAVVSINGGASTVGVSDEFDRLATSGVSLENAAARARSYRGPQGYDPRRDLRRTTQPAMWVFGGKDVSNPTMLDLAEVKRLARAGKPFRWLLLPDTDHELIDSKSHRFDASWIKPVRKFIRGPRPCPPSS